VKQAERERETRHETRAQRRKLSTTNALARPTQKTKLIHLFFVLLDFTTTTTTTTTIKKKERKREREKENARD
jgi:uncharacterized membrane protein